MSLRRGAFQLPRLPTLLEQQEAMQREEDMPTPEEERSLLHRSLGWLQYAGETLAKPQRAVAGAASYLTGGPAGGGLLNLIPFSDTLGITDPQEAVRPSQVMEQWGMLPENEPGADWMDVPRVAADVILDPLWLAAGPARAATKFGIASAKVAAEATKSLPKSAELFGQVLKGIQPAERVMVAEDIAAAIDKGAELASKIGGTTRVAPDQTFVQLLDKLGQPVAKIAPKAEAKAINAAQVAQAKVPIPGTSAAAMAEDIRAGRRGIAALKLPWAEAPLTIGGKEMVLGAGSERAAKMVESAMYGHLLSMPVIRGMFSPYVAGIPTPAGQKARDLARGAYDNAAGVIHDTAPAADEIQKGVGTLFESLKGHFEKTGNLVALRNVDEFLTYLGEMGIKGERATAEQMTAQLVRRHEIPVEQAGEIAAKAHELTSFFGGTEDLVKARTADLGGAAAVVQDNNPTLVHVARKGAKQVKQPQSLERGRRARVFPTTSASDIARRREYNIPGGSVPVNRAIEEKFTERTGIDLPVFVGDRALSAEAQQDLRLYLATQLGKRPEEVEKVSLSDLRGQFLRQKWLDPLGTQALEDGRWSQEEFGRWAKAFYKPGRNDGPSRLGNLVKHWEDKPASAVELGVYDMNYLARNRENLDQTIRALANLEGVHNLARGSMRFVEQGAPAPRGTMSLVEAYHAIKKPVAGEVSKMTHALDKEGRGMFTMMRDWAKQNPEAAAEIAAKNPKWVIQTAEDADLLELAERFTVDNRVPKVASQYFVLEDKATREGLGAAFDKFTRFWARAATLGIIIPRPGFEVRNYIDSALWRGGSRATGEEYRALDCVRGLGEAFKPVIWGKGPRGFDFDPSKTKWGQAAVDAKLLGSATPSLMYGAEKWADEPISSFKGFLEPYTALTGGQPRQYAGLPWYRKWVGQLWAPEVGIAGGKRPAYGMTQEAGMRAYATTEWLSRFPIFHAAMERGMTPSQAKALVDQIQYPYGRHVLGAIPTSFSERHMRTVVPFWRFAQRNIPYHLGQLINRPGGLEAQTIKGAMYAQQEAAGPDAYIPQWMRQSVAVPLGGPPNEQQFLRQLGLSIEQIPFATAPGTFPGIGTVENMPSRRAAQLAVSQMNPILSLIYKMTTGRDPYTQESIKDIRGPLTAIGGPQMLAPQMLASGTPAGPLMQSYTSFADERLDPWQKVLNWATGIRTGTYDLPKMRERELAEVLEREAMAEPGVRAFDVPYLPARLQETASEETKKALKRSAAYSARLSRERRKERALEGLAP